jgi:hypothetical protein
MKYVTFKEIVPGMVLYPVNDVNSQKEKLFLEHIIVTKKIEAGIEKLWDYDRALYYITLHDARAGTCCSNWRTGDDFLWEVIDDQSQLDKIRSYVKSEFNKMRDILDELEGVVEDNL